MNHPHLPVMFNEVMSIFKQHKTYVDCTFGRGGHTKGFLDMQSNVIAIDRDKDAISYGHERFINEINNGQLTLVHEKFSNISQILNKLKIEKVDGVFLDLGLSSPQIDQHERGFSYMNDGNLNMCMGLNDLSAFEIINEFNEEDIASILINYGEERAGKRIAREIIKKRSIKEISTTIELRNIIKTVTGDRFLIKSCARVFQALRIYVNNELNELSHFLSSSSNIINSNGVLCVLSFHSLEDRIIKRFFQYGISDTFVKDLSQSSCSKDKSKKSSNSLRILNNYDKSEKMRGEFLKHTRIFPSTEEISHNSRARSAILRYAIKK